MASILDVLSVSWLKETYLLGVDLTLDDGTDYPDAMFEQSILSAVAHVEHELGIKVVQMAVSDEMHDAHDWEREAWWPFRLDHRPVISINGFRLKYGSADPVIMPVGWCQLVSPEHGQVHLVPSQESIGSYRYRVGIPIIMGDIFQPKSYIPGYFRFDYTAGFAYVTGTQVFAIGETAKTVAFATAFPNAEYNVRLSTVMAGDPVPTPPAVDVSAITKTGFTLTIAAQAAQVTVTWIAAGVPRDIIHVVGLMASMLPLDIAGDLIAGAGIASKAIGVDGLHASVNTTSSATNSGYGARVLQFEKELKHLIPALRAKYRIMQFGVI